MENLPAPIVDQIASRLPYPPTCWSLFKRCLDLTWKLWVMSARVEQFQKELETLRLLRKTVDEAREALMAAARAELELRKKLMEATAVELGKDYQLHWHRKD